MDHTFEKTLAFHCAPALAGIKPSSLISCNRDQFPSLDQELDFLNQQLNPAGIYFRPVCRCKNKVLLLVYRASRLKRHLQEHAAYAYLQQEGYPVHSLEAALEHLENKLTNRVTFPHELGIFLGYPPEDVEGFRRDEGKNCKLCGYWKVYGDENHARELFAKFTRCRQVVYSQVVGGKSIVQIFHAA